MGVCMWETEIGRDKERERSGKEGLDDSLENSLSWEWHFHKYLWKQKTKKPKLTLLWAQAVKQKKYC